MKIKLTVAFLFSVQCSNLPSKHIFIFRVLSKPRKKDKAMLGKKEWYFKYTKEYSNA